jgi:hypothetical protein
LKHPLAVLALTLTFAAVAALPAGMAGTGQSTPVAAVCVMSDTGDMGDACATQSFTSAQNLYAVSVSGVFQGEVHATLTQTSDPTIQLHFDCYGIVAGAVVANGGCFQSGSFPVGAMTLDCSALGTGVATCSVEGQ